MKIDRVKSTTKNFASGIVLQLYRIIVPFFIRTILIKYIGLEYASLSGLFSSILKVLNLAELGVGSAMVFSMYKPIVEDDMETLSALLNLYRRYYRIIGTLVLGIGIVIMPFLKFIIKKDVPNDINIYILYLMFLISTVLSYLLFAYRQSILTAYNRVDIINNISIIMDTIQYIIQIVAIIAWSNYYVYTMALIIVQIISNLLVAYITKKKYPQIKAQGGLKKEVRADINKKIKDIFTAKFGSTLVTSSDNIVISAFLGLNILGIYQNYFLIVSSITVLAGLLGTSAVAGIGNHIITETEENNYNLFKTYTFIGNWMISFCAISFFCLADPFIIIWQGKDRLLPKGMVFLFALYLFINHWSKMFLTFKDATGIWHADRFRPIAVGMTNLILNIIMVNFIGVYGIFLSTILSLVICSIPWLIHNIFSIIYKRSPWQFICDFLVKTVIFILSGVFTYSICGCLKITGIMAFIVKMVICVVFPNVIYTIVFYRTQDFKRSIEIIKPYVKGLRGRLR